MIHSILFTSSLICLHFCIIYIQWNNIYFSWHQSLRSSFILASVHKCNRPLYSFLIMLCFAVVYYPCRFSRLSVLHFTLRRQSPLLRPPFSQCCNWFLFVVNFNSVFWYSNACSIIYAKSLPFTCYWFCIHFKKEHVCKFSIYRMHCIYYFILNKYEPPFGKWCARLNLGEQKNIKLVYCTWYELK